MEEVLTLDELDAIVSSIYEKEERHHRFMAAIKGIDLDESRAETSNMPSAAEVELRAKQRLSGMSQEEIEQDDLAGLGIKMSGV